MRRKSRRKRNCTRPPVAAFFAVPRATDSATGDAPVRSRFMREPVSIHSSPGGWVGWGANKINGVESERKWHLANDKRAREPPQPGAKCFGTSSGRDPAPVPITSYGISTRSCSYRIPQKFGAPSRFPLPIRVLFAQNPCVKSSGSASTRGGNRPWFRDQPGGEIPWPRPSTSTFVSR